MTRREKPVATPRLTREGWVPACPDRRVGSGMLIPKPEPSGLPNAREVPPCLLGQLGPAERIALREIAETGDIQQYNGKTYIVAAISSMTLGTLSAFETELDEHELLLDQDAGVIKEDRERDHDDEPDHDNEFDDHF